MQITVDYDDYVSILAYVRHLSRRLEPVIRYELPGLLGRHAPCGLPRVADAAGRGRLHARGYARDMLPVIVDACTRAIDAGARIDGEWIEVGWSDGGVDWAWRETTVYTDEARSLMRIRRAVSEISDLLDRIDDLLATQRDAGDLIR